MSFVYNIESTDVFFILNMECRFLSTQKGRCLLFKSETKTQNWFLIPEEQIYIYIYIRSTKVFVYIRRIAVLRFLPEAPMSFVYTRNTYEYEIALDALYHLYYWDVQILYSTKSLVHIRNADTLFISVVSTSFLSIS